MTFRGRVQGVGFRATTRDIAARFRVTGWVRNEPDGSVRSEVQGGTPEIDAFLDALGARMSRHIDTREVDPLASVSGELGFEIRF